MPQGCLVNNEDYDLLMAFLKIKCWTFVRFIIYFEMYLIKETAENWTNTITAFLTTGQHSLTLLESIRLILPSKEQHSAL